MRAVEPCTTVHGRAHFYGGDGRVRIWKIGTHHEFEPDDSSWANVMGWLQAGVKDADPSGHRGEAYNLYLFGDFLICPTEAFKKGSVQRAVVKSVSNRRYAPAD